MILKTKKDHVWLILGELWEKEYLKHDLLRSYPKNTKGLSQHTNTFASAAAAAT
jgi:hypothetical protein